MMMKRSYHPDGLNARIKLGRDRITGHYIDPGNMIAADMTPYAITTQAKNHKNVCNVLALGGHVTTKVIYNTPWTGTAKDERMKYLDYMDGR